MTTAATSWLNPNPKRFQGTWHAPELSRRFPTGPTLEVLPVWFGQQSALTVDRFTRAGSSLPPLESSHPGRSKRFAVIGDTGTGSEAQYAVARRLEALYGQAPFANVLMLGDNVYEDGEPHLFQERLRDPYQPLLGQGVRFLPVLGNHDVRKGFGEQQLRYMGVPQYYSTKVGTPGREEVELFAIDTTLLLPGYGGCHKDNPFQAQAQADQQLAWLDQALASSKSPYKIVYGHYPLYASGLHAQLSSAPAKKLREQLEPLFERHGVDLYLAGHEHHYERTRPIRGTTHMVSGGGGAETRPVLPGFLLGYDRDKAVSRHHAVLFEVADSGLIYDVVAEDGTVLEHGRLPQRASQQTRQLRFA